MNRRTIIAAIGASILASACMPGGGWNGGPGPGPLPPGLAPGVLSGTVTYRERIALPRDAVVEISIVDVARQDVAARVIGRTRVQTRGRQVPIPFELRYRGDRPRGRADYAVQARITERGRLLFVNDTRTPLPPNGRIALTLVAARR